MNPVFLCPTRFLNALTSVPLFYMENVSIFKKIFCEANVKLDFQLSEFRVFEKSWTFLQLDILSSQLEMDNWILSLN